MIGPALQAIGLFLVTNIDDIIVLSLFFARGAGQRGTTTRIIAGQYLGFGGILLASVAVTFGAGLFLPDEAIPYFGLIPLLLGVYAGWRVWRNGDDDDDDSLADRPISALAVAAVTFANGGDNIGVYVPVFLAVGTGKFVATRKPIAEVLERWEHILFPLVLIVLGLVILIEGGAFGL